jgi:hypothetical protein
MALLVRQGDTGDGGYVSVAAGATSAALAAGGAVSIAGGSGTRRSSPAMLPRGPRVRLPRPELPVRGAGSAPTLTSPIPTPTALALAGGGGGTCRPGGAAAGEGESERGAANASTEHDSAGAEGEAEERAAARAAEEHAAAFFAERELEDDARALEDDTEAAPPRQPQPQPRQPRQPVAQQERDDWTRAVESQVEAEVAWAAREPALPARAGYHLSLPQRRDVALSFPTAPKEGFTPLNVLPWRRKYTDYTAENNNRGLSVAQGAIRGMAAGL